MALILVVEDDETNQQLVTRFLKRDGHRVIHAADGLEGVDQAQTEMPDLILMDLSLPVLDGWEATRRIKGNPKTWNIPIIALTAHTLSDDVMKAMEAGCSNYETKPIVYGRLMAKIRAVVE
jgi:CheY-like chemotaxis protein